MTQYFLANFTAEEIGKHKINKQGQRKIIISWYCLNFIKRVLLNKLKSVDEAGEKYNMLEHESGGSWHSQIIQTSCIFENRTTDPRYGTVSI